MTAGASRGLQHRPDPAERSHRCGSKRLSTWWGPAPDPVFAHGVPHTRLLESAPGWPLEGRSADPALPWQTPGLRMGRRQNGPSVQSVGLRYSLQSPGAAPGPRSGRNVSVQAAAPGPPVGSLRTSVSQGEDFRFPVTHGGMTQHSNVV